MSFTDPTADPVQPQEGQGDAGNSDAPYAEYLSRIPEEVRGDVEPIFKEWDGNTTRKFQEHAQYRDAWKPYEDLGIRDQNPQDLQQLLEFQQALESNPAGVWAWAQQYAQEKGLTAQEAAQQEQASQFDEFGSYQDQNIEQMLKAQLEQALTPLQQRLEQYDQRWAAQEQAKAEAEAQQFIDGQLAELEQKHGADFNREAVAAFLPNHLDNPREAVGRAWEQYQAFRGGIEKQLLQAKVDAPAPAETGGVPDVNPEKITTFKQAEEQARQFLRNSRIA